MDRVRWLTQVQHSAHIAATPIATLGRKNTIPRVVVNLRAAVLETLSRNVRRQNVSPDAAS